MKRYLGLLLLLLPVLGYTGLQASRFFPGVWNWGGATILETMQGRLHGTVTAEKITGNPITGIAYENLEVRGPKGEVFFQAGQVSLRLSPQSLTAFHLIISTLDLDKPRLWLREGEAGRWNFEGLFKTSAAEAPPSGLTAFLLRKIELRSLRITGGEAAVDRRGAVTRYGDLELAAGLAIAHLGQKEQKIDLNLAEFGVTAPPGRLALATRFSYRNGQADIASFSLKLSGHPLLEFKGDICRPAAGLTCNLAGKLGPLPGEQLHGVWDRWPGAWDLGGAFNFRSVPEGMFFEARGNVGQTPFDLKGQVNPQAQPPTFELDGRLQGLAPAQLQDLKDLDARRLQGLSPLNARLRLEGRGLPWNPASLSIRIDPDPFQYQETRVQEMSLSLQGDARSQEFRGKAAGNFGALNIELQGRLLPLGEPGKAPTGDVKVETKELKPEFLGMRRYPGTVVTSSFSGKFRLPASYSLAQGVLEGELKAGGRVRQETVKDLTTTFSLEGRKLTVREARLQLTALEANFKGTFTERELDATFSATASAHGLPVPRGVTWQALKADGTARGPWSAPQLNLSARVSHLTAKGLSLASGDMEASLAGWPPRGGTLQLKGSQIKTAAGNFAQVQGSARGEDGRWRWQLTAAAKPQPQVELAGLADLNTRPLAVQVDKIFWEARKLTVKNRAPFQVRLIPGWELSPATLLMNGAAITVQALARGDEVSGRLEFQNLDAAWFSPEGLPVQGKINGNFTLAGTPASPLIDGRLTLGEGKIKKLAIQNVTTTLSYRDGALRLDGALEEALYRSRLVWNGVVPVALSLLPPGATLAEEGLDLRLHSEKLDLSLFTYLIPDLRAAQAPLEISTQARGNPRQPQVTGYVRWREGSLEIARTGTPFKLDPGEIRLEGRKVTIPGILLVSDGTLRLTGEVLLEEGVRAQAKAQLDNFLVINRGGNQVWTTGNLDLRGPLNALAATGRLVVPRAQFRPTFFRSPLDPDIVLVREQTRPQEEPGVSDLYRNLRIDVSLTSSGNVWLKDPIGQVEMAGDLMAMKRPGQDRIPLKGAIRALKGTVDVEQRTFTVERAVLTLPGVVGQPGVIDGKATHEMEDITLVLTVTGTLTNPQIRMESQPPLPPADVLSYLVFGAPAATLTREQYLALGVQQLGVLGGVSPKKLDEILGGTIPFLSGVKVKSGMIGGRPSVGVEKEITKNVRVTYGRRLNEERGQYEPQVGIEYKIDKRFSIESQIGPRNSGADVLFKIDF